MSIINTIKNALTPDRNNTLEKFIDGVVREVTDHFEYKFTPEEQAYIIKEINDRFMEKTKDKRNEHINKAREIQNSIKKIESNEKTTSTKNVG